jgi:hypothetical protein
MRVKIVNTVPLPSDDGGSFDAYPGEEHDVAINVAHALERGGDAKLVPEEIAPPAEPPQTSKKKSTRRTKNRGEAPENK